MANTIDKIKLNSENICFGPEPNFDDETRQILTLYRDGHFVFRGYRYGDKTLTRKKVAKVSPKEIQQLFDEIETIVLDTEYQTNFVTDVGTWRMVIYYQNHQKHFFGSLISGCGFDKVSKKLRKITKISHLFAFNNNYSRPYNTPLLSPKE